MIIFANKPSSISKSIEIFELMRINGQILYTRVVFDEIRVIADERGVSKLYIKKLNSQVFFKELFASIPGAKFEMSENYLFVNSPGDFNIYIYSISDGSLMGKISTGVFTSTRKASFRGSDKYLFRIDENNLKAGKLEDGKLEERVLRRVMENQTWFWVDAGSDTPCVFGLFQVIRQQIYWMIVGDQHYDVSILPLGTGEILLDVSVRFSSQGAYLERLTQVSGKNYVRQELIDYRGRVVFSDKMQEINHPNPSVHGQAYSNGVALHATDKGVMQEDIRSRKVKFFSETKPYVNLGDSLIRFGNSILVVKQDCVYQMTTK